MEMPISSRFSAISGYFVQCVLANDEPCSDGDTFLLFICEQLLQTVRQSRRGAQHLLWNDTKR